MKRNKYRIAVLVGVIVMITLMLFLLIFNLVIRRNIRTESESAIQLTLEDYSINENVNLGEFLNELGNASDLDDVVEIVLGNISEDDQSGISVSQILDEDGETISVSDLSDSSDKKSLYSADTVLLPLPESGAPSLDFFHNLQESKIVAWCRENDTSELSRQKIDDQIYFLQSKTIEKYRLVAYVNVTGEYDMIRRVNIIFLIAAVIIGLLGSLAGYLLGKKMDQTQLIQKQFFENTSHELKTPLTAIRGYAEGIEKGVITDYPKTGRVISSQVEQMSTLVEEILSIAKIESGSMPLHKEDVEMSEFIQDCLLPMEGMVKSRSLDVELDLEETTVSADPAQLEHAITNLLTNAIKYAESRIRITCRPGTLTIWNDVSEISSEDLRHIFDRFYTGKNGNTGIGLALAKEITQLHGWTISAEAEDGGVLFRIRN